MIDRQMEMSFVTTPRCTERRQRRLGRAHWWFQRMRQLVDRATDWEPAPPPRPEQIWFAGTVRQPGGPAVPPVIREPAAVQSIEEHQLTE